MARKTVRKSPRQSRSKIVLGSILEAATSILNSDSIKNFTTNQIAKKAGVSIGSLYQYFPNKETILDQILQMVAQQLTNEFLEIIPKIEADSYEEYMSKFTDFCFETCLRYPKLMRQTFHIEKSDETIQLIFENRQQLVNELCKEVRSRYGDFKDLELKTFFSIHAYMGIIEAMVTSPYAPDRKKVVDLYKKTLLSMVDV